jgi:hypothetical protein
MAPNRKSQLTYLACSPLSLWLSPWLSTESLNLSLLLSSLSLALSYSLESARLNLPD